MDMERECNRDEAHGIERKQEFIFTNKWSHHFTNTTYIHTHLQERAYHITSHHITQQAAGERALSVLLTSSHSSSSLSAWKCSASSSASLSGAVC